MDVTLLRAPVSGAREIYRLPARIGRRRRRGRLFRRLLFCVGLALGVFVIAALVWGVLQALNED
ncbi:MAG: hypothetical protein ACKVJG_24230 [Candidatus Latescibacterota bacterium]|jgi:hypothetical protein